MSRISDLYQSVTDSIIAELEAGAAPWVKPWKAGKTNGLMPANAATGRAYSGVNIPIRGMRRMSVIIRPTAG